MHTNTYSSRRTTGKHNFHSISFVAMLLSLPFHSALFILILIPHHLTTLNHSSFDLHVFISRQHSLLVSPPPTAPTVSRIHHHRNRASSSDQLSPCSSLEHIGSVDVFCFLVYKLFHFFIVNCLPEAIK